MTTLDARGLSCPMPVLLARRRMADLRAGETLLVLATDPEAPIDLAAWAADEGHAFRVRSDAPEAGEQEAGGWLELELVKRG